MRSFRAGKCNRQGAIKATLIKPVGQKPARILAFLEKVDRPGELHLVIDGGEVLGVLVRSVEMHMRGGGYETVEI
ncbi:hypothetical protein D3C72_2105270 [compost metagenome]